MSDEKNDKNYTAADIEKYHRRLLSPKEMNELERAALNDPFLADALEGYEARVGKISSDLSELKKKLEERVSEKKVISIAPAGSSFKWWKVAAAVVVLGGLGYFIFKISTGVKSKEVAVKMEVKKPIAPESTITADSNRLTIVESTSVVKSDKRMEAPAKSNQEWKKATVPESNAFSTKDDVATDVNKLTRSAMNDKEQRDSLHVNPSLGVAAPVAVEKKPAIADAEQNNGFASFKKEAVSNNRLQANYFSGRVKDANNNPLPFANITNTQDNVGTYADAQGRFTLVSPDSVLTVQVRSVGFENSKVQLKNNVANNDVVLQENKTIPDKVLSLQKPDTNRSRMANVKFEELEPADGWSNYNTYLVNNINVPADVKRRDGAQGQVQVSFEVNPQGNPVNIRVEKSLCSKCDEEAIRVVKQGPKWKKKSKKAKRITITVPFETEQ
ncbi:MAG TPA: TonB family protein [Chitinophagaceae bacterium]|nr:TonB family protein [Chitinophagaceae bacterium]